MDCFKIVVVFVVVVVFAVVVVVDVVRSAGRNAHTAEDTIVSFTIFVRILDPF